MAVYGIGVLGETSSQDESGRTKSSYMRWRGMLRRCYSDSYHSPHHYQHRGIKVEERWHTFANYEEDIKLLEGYDDPECDSIDRIDNDGDYCRSNCRWASKRLQRKNQQRRVDQRPFVAFPPGFEGEGAGIISANQRAFARKHRLCNTGISGCLRGKQKTHKGWRFRFG